MCYTYVVLLRFALLYVVKMFTSKNSGVLKQFAKMLKTINNLVDFTFEVLDIMAQKSRVSLTSTD